MKAFVNSAVRAGVRQALHLAPTGLWRGLFAKTDLGVCYHMVSDAGVAHLKHYPVLDTAQFEIDLDYLQRRFGFLSYAQLVARRGERTLVRDNAVMLTFDDGFRECADVIAPILRRRGIYAVFFVITDLIDNTMMFRETKAALCIDRILRSPAQDILTAVAETDLDARLTPPSPSGADLVYPAKRPLELAPLHPAPDPRLEPLLHWLLTLPPADEALLDRLCARLGVSPQDYLRQVQPYLTTPQIRRLREDGFTIGAHSRSHRYLQDLPREEAEAEIVESCRIIADITGQASTPFAFPYFGGGLDRAWLRRLRQEHQGVGLFFDTDGLREDEPFVVQRVFGERFSHDGALDAILRRAWARPAAWRRRSG